MATRTSSAELLLRQRVDALRRALPDARDGEPSAIHRTRVATRRLREALPLLEAGKPGRRLARAVRDATRALGPVRELDVALLTLDELQAGDEVPRGAIACLRRVIGDERKRMLAEMRRRLDAWDFDRLRRKAIAAVAELPAPPARDPQRLAAARVRAGRRADRLRSAIDNAAAIYLPDRLHDVRIAVKKLRYALETVRDLSGSRANARILTLKRAQDLLGRMHDLEVLIARARAVQSLPISSDLKLSGELDLLVRHLETECRRLHGQYIASRPALLAICDRVEAAAHPRAA